MTATNNDKLEAALDYARRGLAVLPCHSIRDGKCSCLDRPGFPPLPAGKCDRPGKHPRTSNGFKDATTGANQIRSSWKAYPDANIGIATGRASGIIVIDCDVKGDRDGRKTLYELTKKHGALPDTPSTITGGGGEHFVFKHPAGIEMVPSRTGIAPGIDVRGDSGFIIAPPSQHQSGGRYQWKQGHTLDDHEPPPLPAWLLAIVMGSPDGKLRGQGKKRRRSLATTSGQAETRAVAIECLKHLSQERVDDYDTWIKVGLILHDIDPGDEMLAVWDSWSQKSDKYVEGECRKKWQGFDRGYTGKRATIDTLIAMAKLDSEGRFDPAQLQAVDGSDSESDATALVRLAQEAELFHDPGREPYASVEVNGHVETYPIRSVGFRCWLSDRFYEELDKVPASRAITDALNVIEWQAKSEGPTHSVDIRIAGSHEGCYLDLGDESWQAVEITPAGYKVVEKPPVKYRRSQGLLPLPAPQRGGSLDELRALVNVATEDDWRLLIAWLTAAFLPAGPYPVLNLVGEHGAAKSTQARLLRRMIDPNKADLRSAPCNGQDFVLAANNAWLVALDNLSGIPTWLSDALCRLATGGGFATRKLYTDGEEVIFNAMRPAIVNGIDDVATRGDLADRCITLHLPTIPENRRRTEQELWRDVERARSRILGALLDTIARAMHELPSVRLPSAPRMADFARWGVAVERALGWEPGSFLAAYDRNRTDVNRASSPRWPSRRSAIVSPRAAAPVAPGRARASSYSQPSMRRLASDCKEREAGRRARRGFGASWPAPPLISGR